MLMAVIPVMNEEQTIGSLLDELAEVPLAQIILVLNGCTDDSEAVITAHKLYPKCRLLHYRLPLGVDVPRAIGASYARSKKARAVLFIDGDMTGRLQCCCRQLLDEATDDAYDLTLTNCYPYVDYRSQIAKEVLSYREALNRTLDIFDQIGLATPSHGPHCVSGRLLETVSPKSFAIPPLMMAEAVKKGLKIKVAAALEQQEWSSANRGDNHNQRIADTIIGDCLQAQAFFLDKPISRSDGRFFNGYHSKRRFDLIGQ